MTEVELVGGAIRIPSFAENDDVIPTTEGVRESSNGTEVDIRVLTAGLAGGGAIEVPLREFINGRDRFREGLYSERTPVSYLLKS